LNSKNKEAEIQVFLILLRHRLIAEDRIYV